ncbi:hypothetical protein FXO38_19416 [Capsicum annuum]|nr:hypothetical protein FXO38_19416 [Capsicum annuum]
MEDSLSFSLGLTQLDTNSIVGFVPGVFDYEEPNFVENRSKFRNDPNNMKEIRKAATEKLKKAVGKSSRLFKKDDSGRPRLPKVVGIKVKYEKFMAGMFSKFVYNNIRPTHEEVQSLDLQMIEGFQLKEVKCGFPPDVAVGYSDKRSVVDIQSQVDLDIQGFEGFSTVPPTKILKKAGLITDASTSHPTKKRKTVCFDSIIAKEQVCWKTPSFVSTRTVPTQKIASSDLERVHAEKTTPSSSLNEDNVTASLDILVEFMDVEGISADIGPAILKYLVVAMEKLKPDNDKDGTSTMQLSLDFPDAIVAAHQAAKTSAKIAKRIRTRFKVFKSPYTTKYASGSKAIEDQIEELKQQFAFDGFLISDIMPNGVIEQFKQYNLLTIQQDYVESVWVALIEEAITHIIKGYCMSSGLPWHQVDEVYVPINCNENFQWVLAVIALKDRRIRVYDSLSRQRNTESITEIQKLAKMLSTYLSDSKFYDDTSRTDWPNLETYRDKITQTTSILNEHPFDVEYVQDIMQQECDSVDCGVFVTGYAEYLSEEMNVPSNGFEAAYHRMRYATLLRKYDIQKKEKGYVSENDDPPRPKSRIIKLPDENKMVCIE